MIEFQNTIVVYKRNKEFKVSGLNPQVSTLKKCAASPE
jgi:hypothetical protein